MHLGARAGAGHSVRASDRKGHGRGGQRGPYAHEGEELPPELPPVSWSMLSVSSGLSRTSIAVATGYNIAIPVVLVGDDNDVGEY